MNHSIGTIRTFKTRNFTVIVDALPEDSPVDVDDEGETAAAVDRGEFEHFIARVRVMHSDLGEIASDYLGGCIYRSLGEFMDHKACGAYNRQLAARGDTGRCGSYFSDMVHAAIAEARKNLGKAKSIRVREVQSCKP